MDKEQTPLGRPVLERLLFLWLFYNLSSSLFLNSPNFCLCPEFQFYCFTDICFDFSILCVVELCHFKSVFMSSCYTPLVHLSVCILVLLVYLIILAHRSSVCLGLRP